VSPCFVITRCGVATYIFCYVQVGVNYTFLCHTSGTISSPAVSTLAYVGIYYPLLYHTSCGNILSLAVSHLLWEYYIPCYVTLKYVGIYYPLLCHTSCGNILSLAVSHFHMREYIIPWCVTLTYVGMYYPLLCHTSMCGILLSLAVSHLQKWGI
jgi:hypothetical protein